MRKKGQREEARRKEKNRLKNRNIYKLTKLIEIWYLTPITPKTQPQVADRSGQETQAGSYYCKEDEQTHHKHTRRPRTSEVIRK